MDADQDGLGWMGGGVAIEGADEVDGGGLGRLDLAPALLTAVKASAPTSKATK